MKKFLAMPQLKVWHSILSQKTKIRASVLSKIRQKMHSSEMLILLWIRRWRFLVEMILLIQMVEIIVLLDLFLEWQFQLLSTTLIFASEVMILVLSLRRIAKMLHLGKSIWGFWQEEFVRYQHLLKWQSMVWA